MGLKATGRRGVTRQRSGPVGYRAWNEMFPCRRAFTCFERAPNMRGMRHDFVPATKPTMYFIGVTTRQSSINQVFPLWAERLGLGNSALRGLDFPLHDDPKKYRAAVEFIKRDPLSLGALVTTHKIDLHAACHDLFDVIEPLSRSLGEISSIYKRGGKLHGRAVDPWTSGYALASFLPRNH